MNVKIKKIINQLISFVLVSGIGWILDFTTYFILTKFLHFNVMFANMISAIPAFTYVFKMSNKKIFKNENSRISLKYKYIIYFIYQIILVVSISIFAEFLYNNLISIISIKFLLQNLKIFIKIIITPITMTLNFIIMKNLIEKL